MQAVKSISIFTGSVVVLVLFASLLGVRVELPEAAYAGTGVEYKSVFVSAPLVDGQDDPGWKQVDEKEFRRELQLALDKLGYEGFEVVEVTPILKGRLDTGNVRHGTWGGGFSVTQGVMVLAKKSTG
jgi:hypothetical protein